MEVEKIAPRNRPKRWLQFSTRALLLLMLLVAVAAALIPREPPVTGVALNGYCRVTLAQRHTWLMGSEAFTVAHGGLSYYFAGKAEQYLFRKNPQQFAVVAAGNDVVLAMNRKVTAPGARQFGYSYRGRVFLFANRDSQVEFAKNPDRYAAFAKRLNR